MIWGLGAVFREIRSLVVDRSVLGSTLILVVASQASELLDGTTMTDARD